VDFLDTCLSLRRNGLSNEGIVKSFLGVQLGETPRMEEESIIKNFRRAIKEYAAFRASLQTLAPEGTVERPQCMGDNPKVGTLSLY
jgi:hypothetical protein